MGLFSRGPEKVISGGQRVRARIVAIDVGEISVNDSHRRVDEYAIELTIAEGGRRLGLRQDLIPDVNVRYGMEINAWVRGNDAYIDWKSTMAEQGIEGSNAQKNGRANATRRVPASPIRRWMRRARPTGRFRSPASVLGHVSPSIATRWRPNEKPRCTWHTESSGWASSSISWVCR